VKKPESTTAGKTKQRCLVLFKGDTSIKERTGNLYVTNTGESKFQNIVRILCGVGRGGDRTRDSEETLE